MASDYHSRLRFHFEAKKSSKRWMPLLVRWLKEFGFSDPKFRDGVLEVTGLYDDCMATAVRVASMASFAYEGDVRFFKLGCRCKGGSGGASNWGGATGPSAVRCEYRIKLFPLKI